MLQNAKIVLAGFYQFPEQKSTGIYLAAAENSSEDDYKSAVTRPIQFDEIGLPSELANKFTEWVKIYIPSTRGNDIFMYKGKHIDDIGRNLAHELKKYVDPSVKIKYQNVYREFEEV